MHVRFTFFLKELVLFALAMAAGIFIAQQYSFSSSEVINVEPLHFSWASIFLVIAMFIVFSFILARFKKIAGLSFKFFLFLIILSGAQLFLALFLPSPWDLAAALLLALLNLLSPNALIHNLGMILGISGVGALLGISIMPLTALVVVAALSVYDIIAVYKTRHMVRLADSMIQSQSIFGFLIPLRARDFLAGLNGRPVQDRFMILGSGDIGLPIMLAASLVTTSLAGAIVVGAFATLGLFVTHLLFVNQSSRQAMAALPPIATASIIGFCIALFI